jgi:GGDEF domain-containing protein
LLHAAAQLKNVSTEEMQRAIAEFEAEAAQLATLFQIPPPESGAFERMFVQAHASLAQLAEESILNDADQQASRILEQANELQEELRKAMSHAAQRITAPTKELRGDAVAPPPQAHTSVRPKGPVTGEAALPGAVLAAVERSRSQRHPLSLVLLAVDDYPQVVIEVGSNTSDELLAWLGEQSRTLVDDDQHVLSLGKGRFALLLHDHDRSAAASSARQLLDQARSYLRRYVGTASRPVTISLGLASVALPPRNFSERQLLEAARRCLQAAQCSGGDVVKSIELLR